VDEARKHVAEHVGAAAVGVAPMRRAWLAPCLVLLALSPVAWWNATAYTMTDRDGVMGPLVGVLALGAMIVATERTRSQKAFVIASFGVFTGAGFALALGTLLYGDLLRRSDPASMAPVVLTAAAFGLVVPLVLGVRLNRTSQVYEGTPAVDPRESADAHHPTLQRAALVLIGAACIVASPATPTLFFWLPPLMVLVGLGILAMVAARDLRCERRLHRIRDGQDPGYAVVPAIRTDPQLPPVARWAAVVDVVSPEHSYLVAKREPASYRDSERRDEPIASVDPDLRERAPRAMLFGTLGVGIAGAIVVLVQMVLAPIVSVPSAIRSFSGSGTMYQLQARRAPSLLLYTVWPPYGSPNFRVMTVGYDRARGRAVSSVELFTRLPHDDDAQTVRDAIDLILGLDRVDPLDGRTRRTGDELYFAYVPYGAGPATGRTVNLTTGALGQEEKLTIDNSERASGSMGVPMGAHPTFDRYRGR
jgi:hypothetical protein